MKRFVAAIVLAASCSSVTTSFSADLTDLWWNESESGWGVNVIQQQDTLFLTFFVYGPDNAPTWYSASDVRCSMFTCTGRWGPLLEHLPVRTALQALSKPPMWRLAIRELSAS
jgi:hypothetical protein